MEIESNGGSVLDGSFASLRLSLDMSHPPEVGTVSTGMGVVMV